MSDCDIPSEILEHINCIKALILKDTGAECYIAHIESFSQRSPATWEFNLYICSGECCECRKFTIDILNGEMNATERTDMI